LALILMVLVGGRASVRNRAETFGLERELLEALGELDYAWSQTLKGQVVIVDDTVYHDAPGGREPPRNWTYCHTHGRFERAKLLTVAMVDLSTGRTFMVSPTP